MTCIVGIVENEKVTIGCDSAGVDGLSLTVRDDKKIFRNGEFLIGFTSSFRMGQLLQYKLDPPKHHPDDDTFKYMVTEFIEAVRTCLKDGGFAEKEKEAEAGGTFLVGYKNRLFKIQGDYQVGESSHKFDACGCGEELALGSLVTSKDQSPEKRIKEALKAAETFSAGVAAPFHIETLT